MTEIIYYYSHQEKFLQELGQPVTVPTEWVLFHYTKAWCSVEFNIQENMGVENRNSFWSMLEDQIIRTETTAR